MKKRLFVLFNILQSLIFCWACLNAELYSLALVKFAYHMLTSFSIVEYFKLKPCSL